MLLADNSPPFQASLRYSSEFELYSTSRKWTLHLLIGGSIGNRFDIVRIVKALKNVDTKVPFHVSFSVAEIVIYMQGLHQTAPFPQNKELV